MTANHKQTGFVLWIARTAVGLVFVLNIECALSFILYPERYSWTFELTGLPGMVVVQSLGILFLMWNATYPLVLLNPNRQRTLFLVLLFQQLIGVIGETWLWLQLPSGHPVLSQTGLRFILFDGFGFLIMSAAYLILVIRNRVQIGKR